MSENNDVQDEPASQQLSEEGEPIHHHYHHHRHHHHHHRRHRAMVVFWWLLGILISMLLDLSIFLKTIFDVVRSHGIQEGKKN